MRQFIIVLGIDMNATAPLFLGHVTGAVGRAEHIGDVAAGLVQHHQADADPHAEFIFAPGKAETLHHREDLFSHITGLAQGAILQQDAEFIAAEPRQRVPPAHRGAQQLAELFQHGVAGHMAAGVVDDLEVIEVEIAGRMTAPGFQQALQTPLEFTPV